MSQKKPHYRRTAGGETFLTTDGYRNLVANTATGRDKASWGSYATRIFMDTELLSMYRSSWLARRIVDIPALDACRKWRTWQAESDKITAIEEVEARLEVRKKLRMAYNAARLFGFAALFIGTGQDTESEFFPDSVGKGGLKYLTLLTPRNITPGPIELDATSPLFGTPKYYTAHTGEGVPRQQIHPTRLVVLHGSHVPDHWWNGLRGADSVLQSAYDSIINTDSTMANLASLVFEAKVDIVHIPGLMEMLAREDTERKVINRLVLGARAKGNNGTLILDGGRKNPNQQGTIDGKEEFTQKTLNFGGLPELVDRFYINVAGASEIPITRLFGRSAAGLSGSGDGDERVWFDRIQSTQELEMTPAMRILDRALVRSALGTYPKGMFYKWNPLRQVTEKERAEIFKITSEGARAIMGQGSGKLLPALAVAKALANEFVEQGVMPGFEGFFAESLADFEKELDKATEAAQNAQTNAPAAANDPNAPDTRTVAVNDYLPKSLYVSRAVVNSKDITKWAKEQGFTNIQDDLHVTITYSRTPVDWMKMGQSYAETIEIPAGGPRVMERLGKAGEYIALLIPPSYELIWRHREMVEKGAGWDWDDYQPHISITVGETDVDLSTVKPYTGKIVLGPEIFEEIRE